MKMNRVFVADDEPLFSSLLQQLVAENKYMELAGAAKLGAEVLAFVNSSNTDLLVLDIKMPDFNGDEVLEKLMPENPELKVMILSAELDPKLIKKTISLGAKGFVSKNVNVDELMHAMEKILDGKQHLCADATMALVQNKTPNKNICYLGHELTNREQDVLDLLLEGLTTSEIADKLCLSPRTVETHRRNMLTKFGARNVPHLIKIIMAKKEELQ
jgi:DNA-binding NarL/FixJ family response regulator